MAALILDSPHDQLIASAKLCVASTLDHLFRQPTFALPPPMITYFVTQLLLSKPPLIIYFVSPPLLSKHP
jgi:hypothetical protein